MQCWLRFQTFTIGVDRPPNLSGSSQTDFPFAQHRSKSAFARGRDDLKQKPVTKDINVPVEQPAPKLLPFRIDNREVTSIDDLCRQISEDNDRRIKGMSEERRDRRKIIERLRRDPGEGDNSP